MTAASGNSVEVLETIDDAVADVGGAVGALSVALVALVASDALAAEGGAACADALVDASVGVEGFGAAAVAFAGVLLAAHVDALVVASAWVVACDAAVHASFASSLGLTVLDQNHLGIVSVAQVASLVVAVGAQLGPGVRQRTASGPLGPLGPLGLLGLEVLELMVSRPRWV